MFNAAKRAKPAGKGGGSVPVRALTIDALVEEHMGGQVPSIITTDTEGHDALVI